MRKLKNNVEGIRLGQLTKKYDSLSDFGKEMIFCWMIGFGSMLDDEERFNTLVKEMDNWIVKEQ